MIKLIVQRNIDTGFRKLQKGDEIEYSPWKHKFRGMEEPERVTNGIYVHCFGHGEFEILKSPEEVKRKLVINHG